MSIYLKRPVNGSTEHIESERRHRSRHHLTVTIETKNNKQCQTSHTIYSTSTRIMNLTTQYQTLGLIVTIHQYGNQYMPFKMELQLP